MIWFYYVVGYLEKIFARSHPERYLHGLHSLLLQGWNSTWHRRRSTSNCLRVKAFQRETCGAQPPSEAQDTYWLMFFQVITCLDCGPTVLQVVLRELVLNTMGDTSKISLSRRECLLVCLNTNTKVLNGGSDLPNYESSFEHNFVQVVEYYYYFALVLPFADASSLITGFCSAMKCCESQ